MLAQSLNSFVGHMISKRFQPCSSSKLFFDMYRCFLVYIGFLIFTNAKKCLSQMMISFTLLRLKIQFTKNNDS